MEITDPFLLDQMKRPNFQAGVKNQYGCYLAIMRGEPLYEHGEQDYIILSQGGKEFRPPDVPGLAYFTMAEVKQKFDSGEFDLIAGAIPDRENRPGKGYA